MRIRPPTTSCTLPEVGRDSAPVIISVLLLLISSVMSSGSAVRNIRQELEDCSIDLIQPVLYICTCPPCPTTLSPCTCGTELLHNLRKVSDMNAD